MQIDENLVPLTPGMAVTLKIKIATFWRLFFETRQESVRAKKA
jgi:hypothetical protein